MAWVVGWVGMFPEGFGAWVVAWRGGRGFGAVSTSYFEYCSRFPQPEFATGVVLAEF